jgi:uncharacterized Tic20 family protein
MTRNSQPRTAPSTNRQPTDPGPDVLAERSLLGIFVHSIAFVPLFGLVLTTLIYLVSSHEFTTANARNALNWHLTALSLFVGTFALLFGGEVLPDWLVLLPAIPLMLGLFAASALSMVYLFVATGKAIFGTAWQYPFAYEFLSGRRN